MSVYVQLFEEMISTVEQTVFDENELEILNKFNSLDYSIKYFIVRLSLRKLDKWHRCEPIKVDEMFALKDENSTIQDLLNRLTLKELKSIAKQLKIKLSLNRSSLISALLNSVNTQSILDFPVITSSTKNPLKPNLAHQNRVLIPQHDRLRQLVTAILGTCIRLNPRFYKLLKRVDLVYFRSTEHTPTLLTPAILTRFKKRAYPAYTYTRTTDIWPSRDHLLLYEEALELEATLDDIPNTPHDHAEPHRLHEARLVKALFDSSIYPCWQDLVRHATAHPSNPKRAGLERFDCGFVYTRMVQRCTHALAVLKEHDRELQVLEALLAQRLWRRGRRGAWYDRRALILMTHCDTRHEEQTLRLAMDGLRAGLLDEDTHMVYRPALVRRLARLEKRLNAPPEERHSPQGTQRKPHEVRIEGVRDSPIPGTTGKSLWLGRHTEAVTVEALALQHYEAQGYKGFHSEGAVVRTLFGLLFWDVLFAPVPGAFETPYQAAPLDLSDDAFARARRPLIDARLREIRSGGARQIVERVDDAERARKTWCVGVRWDLFARADLAEIAECLGGEVLAAACGVLCEDYAQRASGVPDLVVWNARAREGRFVEVKGPGDVLQENQKIWIDVLLGAGAAVEVCKVVERKGEEEEAATEPRGAKRRRAGDESSALPKKKRSGH